LYQRLVTKVSPAQPPRPHHDPYVVERRRLVIHRLRHVMLLALLPIGAAAVVNVFVFTDRLAEHLATLGIQGALCGLGAALTFHRRMERWAVWLAAVVTLGIATAQFWAIALAAEDVDVLICAIIAVMMGPTLIYGWGVGPQLVVVTYVAVGYLLLPDWSRLDTTRITNIAIGITVGVVLSVAGAFVLDRQRRATFVERERASTLAYQRERLLDVGRQLNATIDLSELVPLIARLGQRLVDCDVATVTLLDAPRHVFRVVAVARDRPDVRRFEFPETSMRAFSDALAARRVIEIPSGSEFDHFVNLGSHYGVARMLVTAIQRDGRLLGILALNQHALEPRFDEQSIRLAEGIANQAAIALANAELVDDLRRANRVKSEFVSTMSHELRTPLHVILGFAEIGRDADTSTAQRDECLARIQTAGGDLLELIESTLAIGKLEAGRDAPLLEPVLLPELWATVAETCGRLPRDPAVTLEWVPAVPTVSVLTDPRKLSIVLRNLVGNALKFTERGRVQVRAHADRDMLHLAVADTGIGIPVADQRTIFEMFRQADSSDSRRFGGTGLGLYIVQQYTRQLGGRVAVESTPGHGSTFTVTIPLRSPEPGARDAA